MCRWMWHTGEWRSATAPTRLLGSSNARYREAQELYQRDADRAQRPSAIVDNTDLAHPSRVYQDFC